MCVGCEVTIGLISNKCESSVIVADFFSFFGYMFGHNFCFAVKNFEHCGTCHGIQLPYQANSKVVEWDRGSEAREKRGGRCTGGGRRGGGKRDSQGGEKRKKGGGEIR